MGISELLRQRLSERQLNGEKQYRLAIRLGLHPTVLSAIRNGAVPVRPGDPRVVKIARALGIPEDQAFDDVEAGKDSAA